MHIYLNYDPDGALLIVGLLLVAVLILGLFAWGLIEISEVLEAWIIENHPEVAEKWGLVTTEELYNRSTPVMQAYSTNEMIDYSI